MRYFYCCCYSADCELRFFIYFYFSVCAALLFMKLLFLIFLVISLCLLCCCISTIIWHTANKILFTLIQCKQTYCVHLNVYHIIAFWVPFFLFLSLWRTHKYITFFCDVDHKRMTLIKYVHSSTRSKRKIVCQFLVLVAQLFPMCKWKNAIKLKEKSQSMTTKINK